MGRRFSDWVVVIAAMSIACGCYAWSVFGSADFGRFADQSEALAYARDFDRAWRDGDFPPRWAPAANGGRGSLGFTVYPPFFSFLTALFARTSSSLQNGMRCAVLVVTAGVFCAVFFLARSWLDPRRSALAATLSMLLPGTAFIAVGRGMYANFSALLWTALFVGAAQRAISGGRTWVSGLLMVFSGAGMVLSHTLTAYLFLLLLAAISPCLFRQLGWRGLGMACVVMAGILALTSWYWIPLASAGKYTQVEEYSARHPYAASVFFGGVSAGSDYRASWAGLHFAGKLVIATQLALGLALVLSLRRSAHRTLFLRVLPWTLAVIGMVSFNPFAAWLTSIPHFEMTQFAWRWQLFLSLWCALGLASLGPGLAAAVARFTAFVALLFSTPMFWSSGVSAQSAPHDLPAEISESVLDARSAAVRSAYSGNIIAVRPRGADHTYYLPAEPGRIEVVAGEASVSPILLRTSHRRYRVNASTPSTLRIFTYHFPEWTAEIEGNPIPIEAERGTALQTVWLPKGVSTLTLRYKAPWFW